MKGNVEYDLYQVPLKDAQFTQFKTLSLIFFTYFNGSDNQLEKIVYLLKKL
ncbi:MAG: hypothetical protein WDZ35_05760 [Crocinitomicaceae bacterium]